MPKSNTKKRYGIKIFSLILIVAGLSVWYILSRPPVFELDALHISIKDSDLEHLQTLRDEALDKGFLERSPNDFVPTEINYQGEKHSGKVRLKGDWTDHLNDEKWSFRIKLDDGMSDGLQVFSVQNPQARSFLDGYAFHLLLKEEGVLSNEFRFVEVFVNEESWGIYSLEEHLTSRMIANQDKPEGVILKFKDDEFFKAEIDSTGSEGLIETAKIKMYGDAKKDKNWSKEVERAQEIMENYQLQTDSLYQDFDPEKMGMYYAICDLATAYHAMGWINIRFYYNFESHLMEPIGYDAYPILKWGKPLLGIQAEKEKLDTYNTRQVVYSALKDDAIKSAYYKALAKISKPNYLQNFFKKYKSDFLFYESQIQREYQYTYDFDFLSSSAQEIQNLFQNNTIKE